ncbi:hypothetical protein G4Y73_02810 [Wenzhouxiangella sp. XN201]|uniref:hypothetical protein n=1 Tax=Wenzhouxiangella sp. XN201 TaxID=2710755 RepID=UPI0013C61C10|nr:hypothetical protein [Wenzhouxiangella sp. XN201]NEZ03078.1 hypothetical protein [Wenzhouxiangella sp. XN201]
MGLNKRQYALIAFLSDNKKQIDVNEQIYRNLNDAKDCLVFTLDLELRLDLLLENYAALERYVMRAAVNNAIFPGQASSALSETKHEINRLLVNLLSSARLYLDQTASAISRFKHSPEGTTQAFRNLRKNAYDGDSSYRIMEALRNYSQHCSLPAHSISFNTKVDESNPDSPRNRYTVSFGIMPRMLEADTRFNRSALKELQSISDSHGRVEAFPIVREYVSYISDIHLRVKRMYENLINGADTLFENTYSDLRSESGEAPHAVFCTRVDGDDYTELPINRDLIIERKNLERKHVLSGSFNTRYASSH